MRRPVSSVTVRPAGFFAAAGAAGTAEVCGLPIAGADEFCWRNKVPPDAVRCELHTMPPNAAISAATRNRRVAFLHRKTSSRAIKKPRE